MRLFFIRFTTAVLLTGSGSLWALDWRGNLSSEFTYAPEAAVVGDDWVLNTSVAAEVELSHDFADNVRLTFHPFARWDEQDDERTRATVRELLLSTTGDTWEFNAGLGTVFWGVTESRNPVDIINQTDSVESVTGDVKLGQLMLNLKWFSDNYGEFEAFLLPKHHERTFIGENGSPNTGILVDPDLTTYESDKGNKHLDYALRWVHSFDAWDVGLHYFNGTSREPLLTPVGSSSVGILAAPRYPLLQQAGIDALGLYGDLAVKAEIIHQTGNEIESHNESVTGIEYTMVGFLSPLQENDKLPEDWCTADTKNPIKMFACNDRIDLGLVLEHLWDQRGRDSNRLFQNDLLTGLRFAFNDTASSDALLGLIQDLDGGATTLSFEASTRLFESYRLKIQAQKYINTEEDAILNVFDNGGFLQADFSYFF